MYVAMDFITGMPLSHAFIINFVVIDCLLKYAHFMDLKSDYTSSQVVVAESFMHYAVELHGYPESIAVVRDKVFNSRFWQQLFKLNGRLWP
jgi:hypothetical protein